MALGSRRSPIYVAVGALALSTVIGGCGSSPRSSKIGATKPASGQPIRVAISNYAYNPPTLTVAAGAKVTFANRDHTAHTATSTAPGFDTGTISPGGAATVELTKRGTYTFYCQFHAFMRGTIVVR